VSLARPVVVARALAALACLCAVVGSVGTPGDEADRDVWVILDVSRSHGADPAALLRNLVASAPRASARLRLALVAAGADALVVRGPEPRPLDDLAPPSLPSGFVDRTRLERAVELVLTRRDPSRVTEIIVRSDGRTASGSWTRAAAEAARAGVVVRDLGPLAAPAEDLRLEPRGAAEPAGPGRVRLRAAVAGTHQGVRRARVVAEAPASAAWDDVIVPAGESAEIAGEATVSDDASFVSLKIADAGGEDSHGGNDVLRIPVLRRSRVAVLIENAAFDGHDRSALRDALGAFRVERRPSLAAAEASLLADADVAILVDQDASDPRAAPFLAALAEAVEGRAAGLVILGGPRAFRPGGYASTPLERLSPLSSRGERGRDVRVLLDVSGSMEKDERLVRAVDATLRLAEALGPDDVIRVRPFAARPRAPIPSAPRSGPQFLTEASSALRALVAAGGTRLLPALDAELDDASAADRRRVLVIVADADDDALDDADATGARRERLRASETEAAFILLDPRPETEARAAAFGGRVEPVRTWSPRVLLDALESDAFDASPVAILDANGRADGVVPWRNRVRDGADARIALRAVDRAPLVATARRGAGRAAAAACPVDGPTLEGLIMSAARDADLRSAVAERRGEVLVFRAGGGSTAEWPATLGIRIAGSVQRAEERSPGVVETAWDDAYAAETATLVGRDGALLGSAVIGPEGDPEFAFPAGLPAGAAGAAPTAQGPRVRRPWLFAAALGWFAAWSLGLGFRRGPVAARPRA
jgi:hypothetical protein